MGEGEEDGKKKADEAKLPRRLDDEDGAWYPVGLLSTTEGGNSWNARDE